MLKKTLGQGQSVEFDMFTKWDENLLNILVIWTTYFVLILTLIYIAK